MALLLALLVLLLGAGLFYAAVEYLIDREATHELYKSKAKVQAQLHRFEIFPVRILQLGDSLKIEEVEADAPTILRDTTILEPDGEKPYRQLVFHEYATGQWYRFTLSKLLIERQPLLEAVVLAMTVIVALLLLSLMGLNRWLSGRIWKPFYRTLGELNHYQIQNHETIELPREPTDEFDQLNLAIQQLTKRIANDYQNLKEFTENASHEIQTPLAVIRSKIEGLLQDESLSEPQLKVVLGINEATNRLSRLNQALLLLTKIENRQFRPTDSAVNLLLVIETKLSDLEELIEQRQIRVEQHLEATLLSIHPALAEILVSNLLTNAIRHNIEGGRIQMELKQGLFRVGNTGKALHTSPEHLFERFQKESNSSASLGLGLALVKKICEVNKLEVHYEQHHDWHQISVTW